MLKRSNCYTFQNVLIILLIVTLIRIAYLFINHRPLAVDEAQYWSWSNLIKWGYHSKPPMIAWAIWLPTHLFGNSEPIVRLWSPITFLITGIFIYLSGEKLFSKQVGAWAAFTLILSPGVSLSATIMSTDPLQIMFISIGFYLFVRALQTNHIGWWCLAGVAAGLGMLSKYTAVIFPLGVILYLLLSNQSRALLKKPGPYLFFLIAFAVLSPNLYWNAQHQFVSFTEVTNNNMRVQKIHLNIGGLAYFLLCQFAVFGPIAFLALLWVFTKIRNIFKDDKQLLLACFVLPLFVGICAQGILNRAYANWAAPVYIFASIWVSAFLLDRKKESWLKWNVIISVVIALLMYFGELISPQFPKLKTPLTHSENWQKVMLQIKASGLVDKNTKLLFDFRQPLSEAMYYLPTNWQQVYIYNSTGRYSGQLDVPNHLIPKSDQVFIYITEHYKSEILMQRFGKYELLKTISVGTKKHPFKVYVYRASGFIGY